MSIKTIVADGHPEIEDLVKTLISDGVPSGAKMIYKGRNRVYALTLPDGSEVNIKAFKIPRVLNPYIYTLFRKSKARRSYENSLQLMSLGINVPEPLAYIEIRKGVKLGRSYYISRQIDAQNVRDWDEKPDTEPLLRALAKEIVKIQKAGVLHKDFSPGNVLYTGNQTDGYTFYYIDLNRMKFGVYDHRRLMTMFKAISLDPDQTGRLARYFGEAAGLDPETAEREGRAALQHYLDHKARLRRMKRMLRIND